MGKENLMCAPVVQGRRRHETIAPSTLSLIQESGYIPWSRQLVAFDAACKQWFQKYDAS